MDKIIGIDLGTNSIGWAIRNITNLQNQIIDKGVLTFDKGVAEDKSGEHPMVQKRTESRGKRRNYQAEKYRKWQLLEILIENKMCPLTIEELNEWKHYTKGIGRKYPQSEKFIEWLRFDFDGDGKPDFNLFDLDKHESYYLFRKLIISTDEKHFNVFQTNPNIIGRIFYQLVQRRGYNNLAPEEENEEAQKESKTILEGGGEAGAIGVNEIKPYIEKYKTLGAALYHIQKETNTRIRKRYNLRSHFEEEIDEICKVQKIEYLTDKIKHAIIWQRPLRTQKGNVGLCTYLKNKRRCPISHPLYEEYRTWVFINNLKIKPTENNKTITDLMPLKDVLHKIVYPIFYKVSSDFKLSSIQKELKKVGYTIASKHGKEDNSKSKEFDTKVISCTLLNSFKEIFGSDWKEKLDWQNTFENKQKDKNIKYTIEDLWHLHFSKGANKKDKIKPHIFLKEFAKNNLLLDENNANKFTKIRLQQGYATLSLNAIKRILPYLQQGFLYSHSVYLANLDKVMGIENITMDDIDNISKIIRDVIIEDKRERIKYEIVNGLITQYFENKETFTNNKLEVVQQKITDTYGQKTWDKFRLQLQINIENEIIDDIEKFLNAPKNKAENHFFKTNRLHDKIFQHLQETYDIPQENIKYLWHPSEQETYPNAPIKNDKKILGSPEPISKGFKNPMALKTLHQLKHLINYLILNDKIDENTRVVIETARELNNANERKAIQRWQRNREEENKKFKNKIIEINKDPNCKSNYNENDKNLIDKIRLWEEQGRKCLYTGKVIPVCDVLNGTKYDYEHTVPASMSFDNELKNLTIADKKYNQQIKGKRIPFDCPNYNTDYILDGITYTAILPRLDEMKKKVEELEKLYEEWKAKKSDDKQIKDNIIIRRHFIKFDLNYWRHKYNSFIQTEYKAGWRNSQLRDTQTITKYSIPYLKTVFKKVEAQKGTITSDFRKIYKIQPRYEKKERIKHSHHAIDAAVLTLIPTAVIRDKILLRYNEDKERGISYHEKPRQWQNFETHFILDIEDEVLNNYQAQNRTLTPTFKNVRKRGKIQYVKYKDDIGKWHYKLDKDNKKIPLIANGDSIRGQLHAESFYGMIKQPEYEIKNNKYVPKLDLDKNFIFQKNEKRNDELFIVKRELLSDITKFSSIKDFDKIIDLNLKNYLIKEINTRLKSGKTFAETILTPIWAFGKTVDKHGNPLSSIRHIRCKVKGGGGGFVNNPSVIREHKSFISKKEYKRAIYAQNGETYLCGFYQGVFDEVIYREIKTYSILDVAKINKTSNDNNSILPKQIFIKKSKKEISLNLLSQLLVSQKVIFYDVNIDELKDLPYLDLLKRVYHITKLEDGRISFKYHLNSMSEDKLKDEMNKRNLPPAGASKLDFENPIPKLRLSRENFNFAIEHKDFDINTDGSIRWLI